MSYIESLQRLRMEYNNPNEVVQKARSKSDSQVGLGSQRLKEIIKEKPKSFDHPFSDLFNKLYASNEDLMTVAKDVYGNEVALSAEDIASQVDDNVSRSTSDDYDPYNKDYSDLETPPEEVTNVLRAIKWKESSNNPDVVHPVVKSGMYKGQRAIGEYGIMPGNVKTWTEQTFGKSMSVAEFKKDPDAQEQVAIFKLTESLNKHGTIEDALAVWHSGRPLKNNKRVDVGTGLKTTQYVEDIMNYSGE